MRINELEPLGDCAIKAISHATKLDYDKISPYLSQQGNTQKQIFDALVSLGFNPKLCLPQIEWYDKELLSDDVKVLLHKTKRAILEVVLVSLTPNGIEHSNFFHAIGWDGSGLWPITGYGNSNVIRFTTI
jgi:hypothetical protein